MRKPVVAFFGSLIASGTPRGALRLFQALTEELSKRNEIDLICLVRPISDPADPLGMAYEYVDARWFFNWLRARLPITPGKHGWADMVMSLRMKARDFYSHHIPPETRSRLRPIAVRFDQLLATLGRFDSSFKRRTFINVHKPFPESLFCRDAGAPFDNCAIESKVITLDRVDVVLNHWWFHTGETWPLTGRYRPAQTRVLGWFLDAIPFRVAHWQPGMIPVHEFRRNVQQHLEACDEVIAISDSTASDLGTFFPWIRKPIHVVPCGVFEEDFEFPNAGDNEVLDAFNLRPDIPTLMCIGLQEPSKNTLNMLKACAQVAQACGQKLQIFVAGSTYGFDPKQRFGFLLPTITANLHVVFGGNIDDAAKRALLRQSTMLVYASKWEGFGIPPLEAMAAGLPVVVGDVSSFREVCGEFATYCDPYDIADIAYAVRSVLEWNAETRRSYAKRARAYAKEFLWKTATDRLVEKVILPVGGPSRDLAQCAVEDHKLQIIGTTTCLNK